MSIVKEQVVGHMSAILKALDCVICLSHLKNPVSMGCGHFFCRYCITEVLKSNYRAPCPLCKISFTRRSIEEANQRNSVILAAVELATACGQFTGVNFSPQETVSRENENDSNSSCSSFKDQLIEPQENCKPSTSKKRKSSESDINENVPRTKPLFTSNVGSEASAKDSNCASTEEDIIPASNKRQCKSVEDDDDEWDLPSLEEILGAHRNSKSVNQQQAIDNIDHENQYPIVLAKRITDIQSHIKKPCGTSDTQSLQVSFIDKSTAPAKSVGLTRERAKGPEKGNLSENEKQENNSSKNVRRRGRPRGSRLKTQEALRNKKNALKNKTNELISDEHSTGGNNISKIPTTRTKSVDMNEDLADELVKENKKGLYNLFESPLKGATLVKCISNTVSPSDLKILEKTKKRQTKAKNSKRKSGENTTSDSSAEEEALITNLKDAANHQLTVLKETTSDPVSLNGKECYNLSETNIQFMDADECHMAFEQPPQLREDNSKSYRITDTAVSVQSVTSPVTSKLDILSKSPGWSKVRQVGKDFRVRKFSKLSIEKNSSNMYPMEPTTLEEDQNKDNLSEKSKFNRISDPDRVGGDPDSDTSKLETACKNIKPSVLDSNTFESLNQSEKPNSAEIIVKAVVHSKETIESNSNVVEQNAKDVQDVAEESNKSETTKTSMAVDQVFDQSQSFNTDSAQNEQKELNTSEEILEENGISTSKDSCIVSADAYSIIMHERDSKVLDMDSKCATYNESIMDTNSAIITNIRNSSFEKTNDEMCNKPDIEKFSKSQEYPFESRVFDMEDNYGVENEDLNSMEAMEVDVNNKPLPPLCKNVMNYGDASYEDQIIKQTNLNKDIPSPPSMFRKQDFTKMRGSDFSKIRKDKIRPSKFSKISKCQFTATESFIDEDENIYYAEHSQQTSQRLLEFCGNNNGQHRRLSTAVTSPDVSLYSAMNIYKEREPCHNQIALLKKPGFADSERTKVLKRTCLTLDEIQDAFAISNKYGRPQAICSLPFSFGKFKLQIDVADETLNISVLKVLDSIVSDGMGEKTPLLLSEKNIQTSSSLPATLTILPASNDESESSEPDNCLPSQSSKPAHNPFPYLNQYFSDTESTQQCIDTPKKKEMQLNESEVISYFKPVSNGSNLDSVRNEFENENILLSDEVRNDYQHIDTLHSDVGRSEFPNKEVIESDVTNGFQDDEVLQSDVAGSELPKKVLQSDAMRNEQECTSYQNDMPYDLLATQPVNNSGDIYELKEQKSSLCLNSYPQGVTNENVEKQRAFNIEKFSHVPVETLHPEKNGITESDKPKLLLSANKERSDKCDIISSPKEHDECQEDNFQSSIYIGSVAVGKSYSYAKEDCCELSSDPDMAFATELVAPLKNIAEKMKASVGKGSDTRQEQMSRNFSSGGPLKQKRPLEIFEELVLSKNDDSFGNNLSSLRPSKLSLKSKRNSKKFKRIKKCNSSDDSDSSESYKAESTQVKNSTSKSNCKISPTSLSTKGSLPNESLPGHCTLNSFLSEDMTNVNSSEIVMEIEDLDKKILSVVEKLKECGHADLLNDKNAHEATTTLKKNSPKASEDCAAEDDSENSTDIFSVPPTPPDAVPSNNDSTFKTAHCNN